jgi:hypothetical protein
MPVRVVAAAVVPAEREPVTAAAAVVVRVALALPRQAPLRCLEVSPPLPSRPLRWVDKAAAVATLIALTQAALSGVVAVERAPEPQTTSALLAAAVCTAAAVADVASV